VQQVCQYPFDTTLRLLGCQLQDTQVFLGGTLRLLCQQGVVGQAEAAGGEQVGSVAIIDKRPWLTHQPVDDVTVLDFVFASTTQTRQRLHELLGIPHLDPLGVESSFDPFTEQSAGHRVDVALHPDGAARVHPHLQSLARLQTLWR
jgi:hypothetical protein